MRKYLGLCVLFVTVGCSSTGIVPMEKDTYLTVKKSAQIGYGPPVGVKAEVYAEANEFCAKKNKAVETVSLDLTNAGFARSAVASLEFRCIPK